MGLIRPSVLLLALVMSAPAAYLYVLGDIDETELLLRYLIAVPVAAIMLAALRFVTSGYGRRSDPGPMNLTGRPKAEPPVVTPEKVSPPPD